MALEKTLITEPVGPALDLCALAELANMQRSGRPGFMDRVIRLFLEAAEVLIAEMKEASGSGELTVLQRASHTLKPCSVTVGALSLASLCETLEHMAQSGSVPDPAARVTAIAEEYERVQTALNGQLCHAD